MTTANKKLDRLDLRVKSEVKAKLKRASKFVNEDMTEFVMKRVMPDVERILEAERKIRLNDTAWESFESMLLTPRKASTRLKESMKEYSKIQED